MKKTMIYLLLVCLLLTMLPVAAMATEVETTEEEVFFREPYQCGADLTWSLDGGTLTISGSGEMDDYPDGDAPWLEHKDSITKVVFSGSVTYVGACAFKDYDTLKEISFGPAMHTIGEQAFQSCDGLTKLYLPDTFRKFGKECFRSCESLIEIRCRGGMPRFDDSCLWDVYATVFYPTTNAWPADPLMQLFQAFQGRIQFQMADPSTLVPEAGETQQTIAPTQAPTEPPVTEPEPTTVPTETTAPVTEETTEATTEATTEPTEEVTEKPTTEITESPTEEPTEETEPEEKKGIAVSGIWFGLFLITGTLSLILIGALIFRPRRY